MRLDYTLRGQGTLTCSEEPLHAPQRPCEHHKLRRGSARRAAPHLVHCPAALHTSTLVRGQLCRAARVERASTCLDTVAPDTHGERGMVSDVQEGRGKADDGSRARLRDHLHRQSYRSRFRRRPIAQLDVHRQAGAALHVTPCCDPSPARALSTFAARIEVGYNDRNVAVVPFQVRGAESDAGESTRGRKTFLTRIEEKRQHCLAVHAALSCVRGCSADLENLRHARSVPQIFRVSGAASDAREQRVFRKTDLEHAARKLQISAALGWTQS